MSHTITTSPNRAPGFLRFSSYRARRRSLRLPQVITLPTDPPGLSPAPNQIPVGTPRVIGPCRKALTYEDWIGGAALLERD